jgi:arabinose operon protein AraL
MDGTIYLEDKMINGAVNTLNYLIDKGKHILFVTNKTTQTKEEYAEFLNRNGVQIASNQIFTAADSCIMYLQEHKNGISFYAIAENSFINSVINAGLKYSENPSKIKIIIVTLDRNFSQNKFEIAKKAIQNGAEFLAANIDSTCPIINGEISDAGAIIANLQMATNKNLEKHFGKPSDFMISMLEENLKFKKDDYLLVGDRLETDIFMGTKMGIDTVLVNSGIENKKVSFSAKFNLSSIKEILD